MICFNNFSLFDHATFSPSHSSNSITLQWICPSSQFIVRQMNFNVFGPYFNINSPTHWIFSAQQIQMFTTIFEMLKNCKLSLLSIFISNKRENAHSLLLMWVSCSFFYLQSRKEKFDLKRFFFKMIGYLAYTKCRVVFAHMKYFYRLIGLCVCVCIGCISCYCLIWIWILDSSAWMLCNCCHSTQNRQQQQQHWHRCLKMQQW